MSECRARSLMSEMILSLLILEARSRAYAEREVTLSVDTVGVGSVVSGVVSFSCVSWLRYLWM